jgi:ribosome-binding factor A
VSNRSVVLAEQFRQIISEALLFEMRDPNLRELTVTQVSVSADLQFVDLRFTTGTDETRDDQALAALNRAKGALKRVISRKVKLKRVPDLRFHIDDAVRAEARINQILENLDIPEKDPDEA